VAAAQSQFGDQTAEPVPFQPYMSDTLAIDGRQQQNRQVD
jgi:hypothetical protein